MKINHSSKKIIKSFKWFGVTFYERERLSEKPLQFEFEPVHCADIGLYVIGKYPRLKFNNTSFSEDFNWQLHAISTIRLTILNMINNGVIEIIKVENRVTYIYKSFPKIEIDFSLKVSDLQVDNDWFSQLVYKTINEVNQEKYTNLRQYVKAILDKVIYAHSTYNNPSRAFIIQILRKYTKAHSWIQIDTKSRFLGLLENSSLKVAEIYIPRLHMQHESLSNIDNQLLRIHKEYSHFCHKLQYEIKKDFRLRKPNDG